MLVRVVILCAIILTSVAAGAPDASQGAALLGPSPCMGCATNDIMSSVVPTSCAAGFAQDASAVCVPCLVFMDGCLDCSSNTTCTFCDIASNFFLDPSPSRCFCNMGYYLNMGACVALCGDGYLVSPEICDDGNLLNGDGCDNACNQQPYFTCTTNPLVKSICTSNQIQPQTNTSILLVAIIKDATSNTLALTFVVSPALSILDSLNFSQAITTSLANTSQLSYSYNRNGTLTLTVHYNTTIQSQNITLTFNPSTAGVTFADFAPSNISFIVNPNNNLAAVYSDDSTYDTVRILNIVTDVILYGSLSVFFISLFLSKFIGVEMMGVVQIAFIALITVPQLPPLMGSLSHMVLANGYNGAFDSSSGQLREINQTMPYQVTSLSYLAPMAYSLNYTILILILPLLVSSVLFVTSKLIKNNKLLQGKLIRWAWSALGEQEFTAVLFVMYHAVASLMLFALYEGQISPTMLGLSIADALVVFGLTVMSLVLFKLKPQHFGDYRKAFHKDALSQCHYFLLVASRFILAAILVTANMSSYVGFICMPIPLLCSIYIVFKRPYNFLYNNIRACTNQVVVAIILAIYGYLRAFTDSSDQNSMVIFLLPCLEVALLIGCLVMNAVFIVKYWWDSRKVDANQPAQPTTTNQQPFKIRNEGEFLELTNKRLTSMISQSATQRLRLLSGKAAAETEVSELKGDGSTPQQTITRRISLKERLLTKKQEKSKLQEASISQEVAEQIQEEIQGL